MSNRVLLLLSLLMLGCATVPAQIRISEFMASNSHTLADEDGSFEDWIEIQNTAATNVNLLGWSLTDNKNKLAKWQFPATNLPPGGFLVVFASNEDRDTAGRPLHTNFKLSADANGYLALVMPDGVTKATEFASYPAQFPDVSYGIGMQVITTTLLASNAPARVLIPGDGALEDSWALPGYGDGGWRPATNGVGFETGIADAPQVSFTPYLATDVQTMMYGSNATAYVRIPFTVADPALVESLALQMRYDDGFVVYLNGQEIARQNAPDPVAWNSAATASHPDDAAVQWENFDVSPSRFFLQAGTNILALRGLNLAATNVDFLEQAQLFSQRTDSSLVAMRYLTQPSPGSANGFGTADLGPIFLGVGHSPAAPRDADNLVVTARVAQAFFAVSNVALNYRVMFSPEIPLKMNDAGTNGDTVAGDHVWSATIPASASAPGQMVRYYVTAADTTNHVSRWPIFPASNNSEQYLGTVVADTNIQSLLPVAHLFVEDTADIDTTATTTVPVRGSLYYLGEFYDNIQVERHGQSSRTWPKKSMNLDFNADHRFLYQPGGVRQKDIKLLSNYGDKTRLHTTLTYEKIAEAGGAAHFSFQVRVHRNGTFYGIEDMVEDADENWLARIGYDPDGALYKMYNALDPAGGNEKKTRTWENTSDLTTLINNLNESLSLSARARYAYDNIDLPQTITYFATLALASSQDHGHKNYYLYHDNDGTGEWAILPWDVDLTWGRDWLQSGGYFQDTLFQTNVLNFYPGPLVQNKTANPLYDLMFDNPDFRRMYLRRLRTLMDTMLMPPGAPTNRLDIEPRMRQLADLMDPPGIAATNRDAALDRAKWAPAWGDPSLTDLRTEVERTISVHLPGRRDFLYNSQNALLEGERVPAAQFSGTRLTIASWDYNPASGNQDEEYVELRNTNTVAVDVSGWKLDGGIQFTCKPGTVIPAGASLYLSPNVKAFRARATGPRGGQGLYVQDAYSGHLSAQGESLTLTDDRGFLVASNGFNGTPSPAQQFLRVTEIMYAPSPAPGINSDAQQFEYIELKNISTNTTLDLTGVRFTNGIAFNFTGGAVTNLAPGQTIVLVRNTAAFLPRYGLNLAGAIAGQFTGALDNSGETLRLEDAGGEKILEFAYDNSWYPVTDGLGFSLVIVNELAPWETWGDKSSWRASGAPGGSPGTADPAPPAIAPVLINEALTHTDLPQVDTVELFNPTASAVNIGGWLLTDDIGTPKKYRIPDGTMISAGGFLLVTDTQFDSGADAFRLDSHGEQIYLFSADTNTNLTGYVHGFDFDAAPNGQSFGRYLNSQGDEQFVLQNTTNTLGASNAYPRVGPVVISEVMYRPPDINGGDDSTNEFIELRNIAATNAPLYDPNAVTNTWHLRNAVDFDFPTNQSLAPGAHLLVVGFNPADSTLLANFRAKYNAPLNVPVFGPWDGKLDNGGETIELKRPDVPDVTPTNITAPYILVEAVKYADHAPWPPGADGVGNSLQRVSATGYANDPTNWFAAGVTAGRTNVPDLAPVISISAPADGATSTSLTVNVSIAANDADGSLTNVQLLDVDTVLTQWAGGPFNFTWANAGLGPHRLTAIATDNLGAVTVSAPVTFNVAPPPGTLPSVAILAPTNGTALVAGSTTTFSAGATPGSSPVTGMFYLLDGSVLLGSSSTPPFSFNWTAGPAGSHTLSAVAHDSAGHASAPASISLTVQAVTNISMVFIESNSPGWKYLDNGTDQGTNWINFAFNDSSWSVGTAQLGYGDGGEATVLNFGPSSNNKYITYYFRKKFVVNSLAGITNATISLLRDDGAIAYINGVEVDRDHMPGGTVTYLTDASSPATDGADESTYFPASFSPSVLVVGTNILAVEVHQQRADSSDISLDVQLTVGSTLLGPAITTQPASQAVNPGSNVTFTVSVAGSDPFAYRWYFSNAPLANFTNSLTVTNAQTANAGAYVVVVSNFLGSVTSSVATLSIILPDTDGDGLPDWWEIANGTNPNVNDAGADPDHDGLSNLQEYLAGTNPANAASALKFESTAMSGTNLTLNFTAISNHSYTIQFLPSLGDGAWQKWLDIVAAPSNRTVWLTNAVNATTNRFFRIATPLQP